MVKQNANVRQTVRVISFSLIIADAIKQSINRCSYDITEKSENSEQVGLRRALS